MTNDLHDLTHEKRPQEINLFATNGRRNEL